MFDPQYRAVAVWCQITSCSTGMPTVCLTC